MGKPYFLILEGNESILRLIGRMLTDMSIFGEAEAVLVRDLDHAMHIVTTCREDLALVISDRRPDGRRNLVSHLMQTGFPMSRVILTTGGVERGVTFEQAQRAGAIFVPKGPSFRADLLNAIKTAFEEKAVA